MTYHIDRDRPLSEFQPVPLTHPDDMAIAALKRGLTPAWPPGSTVLEIACGEGVNIIPMASFMPETRFVGIDASETHTTNARKDADELGLGNVEFLCGDLVQLLSQDARFDYLIIPNVFPLLSDEARHKVLEIAQKIVNPHGLIFLNYATEASWTFKTQLRPLLQRHALQHASGESSISALRKILDALTVELIEKDDVLGNFAAYELAMARSLSNRSLELMFLSPHYRPAKFSTIVHLVEEHDLSLVGEMREPSNTLRPQLEMRERLQTLIDDPYEAEDLAELVTCPQIRALLLCHSPALSPALSAPREVFTAFVERGYFACPIEPRKGKVNFDQKIEEAFITKRGQMIRTRDPFNKATLTALMSAWPKGAHLSKLVEDAQRLLAEKLPQYAELSIDVVAKQAMELLALGSMGNVTWSSTHVSNVDSPSECPRVFDVTRWQATRGHVLTCPQHQLIGIDEFTRRLVPLLDGTRRQDALVEEMTKKFKDGELEIKHDETGKKETLDTLIPRFVQEAIAGLAKACLFEEDQQTLRARS